MSVAILDIGTNTVLLLVAEQSPNGLRALADRHEIVRLGEGVDRTRRISEDARLRLVAILRKHQETIEEYCCERIVAIATSAMRDAQNSAEIIRRTKQDTGIDIELLSGDDEARWTYRGAITGMQLAGPVGVVDIGGGSTEISVGIGDMFERGSSINIGAVRLTERCFAINPVASEARDVARMLVRETLKNIDLSLPVSASLVAVAGTATTLAAMHQELPEFDASKVHGYVLSRQAIDRMLEILFSMDTTTLLKRFPSVNKARADILPAGALILTEVMDYLCASSVTVSTQGLRYGIALREIHSGLR